MLKFSKNGNKGIEFELLDTSSNYNPDLIKQFYEKYFTNNNHADLLKLNIDIVKECEFSISKSKELDTYGVFDDNPLALFNECFTSYCTFNRSCEDGKLLRESMEKIIIDQLSNYESDELIYTSYMPGSYFQDIVILTQLGKLKKIKNITVRFITTLKEYLSLITVPNFNPEVSKESLQVGLNWIDDNKDRQKWGNRNTFMIIKLYEWFNTLNLFDNIKFVFYGSHQDLIEDVMSNNIPKSDITIGIDFIDEISEYFLSFWEMTCFTTKINGYISCLTSPGGMMNPTIYFGFSKLIEDTQELYNKYTSHNENTKKILLKLKDHEILDKKEITENNELFPRNPHKDYEKMITLNGKEYHYKSTYYVIGKNEKLKEPHLVYQTKEYKGIEKEIDELKNKYTCDIFNFVIKEDNLDHITMLQGYKSTIKFDILQEIYGEDNAYYNFMSKVTYQKYDIDEIETLIEDIPSEYLNIEKVCHTDGDKTNDNKLNNKFVDISGPSANLPSNYIFPRKHDTKRKEYNDNSPLVFVCERRKWFENNENFKRIVKKLAEVGADINIIHQIRDCESVKLLLELGADIGNIMTYGDVLKKLIDYNDIEMLKILIDHMYNQN